MPRSWTPAQQAAIEARHADILVAAAAGSGKTAVLVERIIQRITDKAQPVDLDRLLVVTFTNAAAAEMRQRIGNALTERLEQEPQNELLQRQLNLLPKASITTIHAFCHRILRSNFNLLGLDPGFRLADPTEAELLRLSALEEVIEEMYEDSVYADSFLQLTEAYLNLKHTEDFYELVNSIYDFSMSLPKPEVWLREAANRFSVVGAKDLDSTPYGPLVLTAGKNRLEMILRKYDTMIKLSEEDDGGEVLAGFLREEQAALARFLEQDTYDGFAGALRCFAFESIPAAPRGSQPVNRPAVRKLRDRVKYTDMPKMTDDLFLLSGREQQEVLAKLHPLMCCLSELVCRMQLRFREKKDAKNLLDYNDLEHFCYRLFVDENNSPAPLAETVREQFEEILIDEYQDTSALQEAIFGAVKRPGGLFLVGDVKQSIYRFRNTNPLLFRQKKDSYSEAETAPRRKIILSKNFRSRKGVLDCINYVFMRLMSIHTGEIAYNEEEMLYSGADYPEMLRPLPEETELCLAEMSEQADDEESLEAAEAEALLAARRIQALMEGGYQVLGKEGVRQLRYRDICVLMRSTKTADCFAGVLSDFGIPCYSEAGSSFLESEEITVMLSLLKIIDNPHQDIPLLAVLRSQLYALTPDELAEIRLADRRSDFYDALRKRAEQSDALGQRLAGFVAALGLYREKSRQLDTAELVWYLYMQTGFYEAQATLPGGTLRRMNLRLLYIRAAGFEKTGLKGLYSFIRFIDEYRSIGGDYDAARTIGEEQDVVRIMSIHKSKGLEFPVVILSGVGRRFYTRDLQGKILFHSELGYGPQYVDTDLGIVYGNAARNAVKEVLRLEGLSEEMRILYVAMTRAREKLILLGSGKHLAETIKKCTLGVGTKQVPGPVTAEADSYLEWLFMALVAHPDGALLRELGEVSLGAPSASAGSFAISVTPAEALLLPAGKPEKPVETSGHAHLASLLPLLDLSYDYQDATELPAKITVTEVKRALSLEEPDSVYLYPRPVFLRQRTGRLSAAEVGTAVHTVLERLNYGRCRNLAELQEQIDTLREQGLLSAQEAAAVPAEKLLTFMQSDIGKRLQRAEQVEREVSFGITADAEAIWGKKGQVMLQGMIDCVLFEETGISILDYKTDRHESPEAILRRYQVQLECYAKAAELIYGRRVCHKYLYLFHYDRLLEL